MNILTVDGLCKHYPGFTLDHVSFSMEAGDMFGLAPGDSLILLADRERGIALQSSSYYDRFVRAVFDQGAKAAAPDVPEAETQVFAAALAQELKREDGQ